MGSTKKKGSNKGKKGSGKKNKKQHTTEVVKDEVTNQDATQETPAVEMKEETTEQTQHVDVESNQPDREESLAKVVDPDDSPSDSDASIASTHSDTIGMEQVFEGGMVKKTIITKGKGYEKPEKGHEVTVHYVGTLMDGTKFDSSRDRLDCFKFTLGKHEVIKGWDTGVATMKKGEKALFTIDPSYAYGERGSPPKIPANATLQFEVELIHWTFMDDVTDDQLVQKRVLKKGRGWEKPGLFSPITVIYSGFVKGSESPFLEVKEATELNMSDIETLNEGLQAALGKMKKEETAEIHIDPSYGYGSKGNSKYGIPPNTHLVYKMELCSFVKKVEVYTLDPPEKIDTSIKLKEYGNLLVKHGRYRKAVDVYKEAISSTEYEDVKKLEDENKKRVEDTTLACHNNSAMCYLKIQEYAMAIEKCNEVLLKDRNNVKALLRRGQAYAYNKDNELAFKDFKRVQELDPKNANVVPYYKAVQKRLALDRAKAQKLFGGFFNKLNLVSDKEVAVAQERERNAAAMNDEMSTDSDSSDDEN